MKTKHFINQIEKTQLVSAIQKAQQDNCGDIVLLISEKKVDDAVAAAHASFQRLSREKTTHPSAVLIFLAPESQRLAVIGGTEIYKKLPAVWWEDLVREITQGFQAGHLTDGLIAGIEKIGAALDRHFPTSEKIDRTGQSDFLEEK